MASTVHNQCITMHWGTSCECDNRRACCAESSSHARLMKIGDSHSSACMAAYSHKRSARVMRVLAGMPASPATQWPMVVRQAYCRDCSGL